MVKVIIFMVALLPILVCYFTSVAAKVIKFMFINSWRYTGYDSFSISSQSSASVSWLALCPIVAAWFQLTSRGVKNVSVGLTELMFGIH